MQSQEWTKAKRPTCRPIKNRGWKEEVKPRTDKRPMKYEGCLMCICICYVHTDTILDYSHCTFMANTQRCTWSWRTRRWSTKIKRESHSHVFIITKN